MVYVAWSTSQTSQESSQEDCVYLEEVRKEMVIQMCCKVVMLAQKSLRNTVLAQVRNYLQEFIHLFQSVTAGIIHSSSSRIPPSSSSSSYSPSASSEISDPKGRRDI